jgi:hypothetical protein
MPDVILHDMGGDQTHFVKISHWQTYIYAITESDQKHLLYQK